MAHDLAAATTPTLASTEPGSVRDGWSGDFWAALGAFLGALGVGMVFAQVGQLAGSSLLLGADTYWLAADATWQRANPTIFVVATVLAAALSRRWGWLVAASGLAFMVSLTESGLARPMGLEVFLALLVVTGGVAVGGALATFGVADRWSRLAVAAGLAIGMLGGHSAFVAYAVTTGAEAVLVPFPVPLALCGVAGLVWLLRGTGTPKQTGESTDAGPRRPWATPVLAGVVAVAVTAMYLGLAAQLNALGRVSASPRRLAAIETLLQVGSFGIVLVAGLVLATYAYRRGGSVLARWVLVGLATGIAHHFTGDLWSPWRSGASAEVWLTVGVAAAGGLAGSALSRFAAVPWDALGLVALAGAAVLRSPQGQVEFIEQGTTVRLVVVFTLGFVLAASLTALSTQTSLRGVGGPGEVAVLVGLGFVASVLATSVLFPASLLANQYGSLGLAPAIAIGIVAVGVLALYGLGRVARSLRRAIEAEARREAN